MTTEFSTIVSVSTATVPAIRTADTSEPYVDVMLSKNSNDSTSSKIVSPGFLTTTNEILLLKTFLSEKLIDLKQWENYTAYPVEDSYWGEKLYSRINAATEKFYNKKEELAEVILNSNGNAFLV